ncbi:MAG: DUF3090 domain-containing protein [Anaerolineae bacterium]|jgi:uncharacterized repeat protein (TIGR03847 family)|nr:DUF3090 domain-containing protein [Anaerolineae bacterium]
MPNVEIDLNPVDFVTIGTIGPKGQRTFYLQAGQGRRLLSMIIEKEQAWALGEALRELLTDLDERKGVTSTVDMSRMDMDLREPIEPLFRVSRMGLGYDEEEDRVVLIAQELMLGQPESEREQGDDTEPDPFASPDDDEDEDDLDPNAPRPSVVRLWCSREQMKALSDHGSDTVRQGRADPRLNGRLVNYWT